METWPRLADGEASHEGQHTPPKITGSQSGCTVEPLGAWFSLRNSSESRDRVWPGC